MANNKSCLVRTWSCCISSLSLYIFTYTHLSLYIYVYMCTTRITRPLRTCMFTTFVTLVLFRSPQPGFGSPYLPGPDLQTPPRTHLDGCSQELNQLLKSHFTRISPWLDGIEKCRTERWKVHILEDVWTVLCNSVVAYCKTTYWRACSTVEKEWKSRYTRLIRPGFHYHA